MNEVDRRGIRILAKFAFQESTSIGPIDPWQLGCECDYTNTHEITRLFSDTDAVAEKHK